MQSYELFFDILLKHLGKLLILIGFNFLHLFARIYRKFPIKLYLCTLK